ncbi:MAG TPA: DUF4266 domain-containing protein [Gammaproteobacteria bacterium]|jgi:hypothetical protein|nr:DUF4266 domain-containing protein [Gammaproteobacteria bacterium]MBT3843675.1 DUF4266 domain-containing protein [Gammaproteobacteria bacterium]MBT5687187.1 DUF4266 domain-containing protein [Gammaproteobacteria bacterium]MBT6478675.1 DUF4266 domain-containing protein [Gammaproteobacteria bacterium]MBT6651805.1 DUF4266 domain-containing protein [Gammaproteobacteria bacterium]
MSSKHYYRGVLILILSIGITGCGPGAKPWERGYLAKPAMSLQQSSTHAGARQKVYSSRESVRGSASVGGGGCGCN